MLQQTAQSQPEVASNDAAYCSASPARRGRPHKMLRQPHNHTIPPSPAAPHRINPSRISMDDSQAAASPPASAPVVPPTASQHSLPRRQCSAGQWHVERHGNRGEAATAAGGEVAAAPLQCSCPSARRSRRHCDNRAGASSTKQQRKQSDGLRYRSASEEG